MLVACDCSSKASCGQSWHLTDQKIIQCLLDDTAAAIKTMSLHQWLARNFDSIVLTQQLRLVSQDNQLASTVLNKVALLTESNYLLAIIWLWEQVELPCKVFSFIKSTLYCVRTRLLTLAPYLDTWINKTFWCCLQTTGSRYKTSICALPVAPSVSPAASAPAADYPDAMKWPNRARLCYWTNNIIISRQCLNVYRQLRFNFEFWTFAQSLDQI